MSLSERWRAMREEPPLSPLDEDMPNTGEWEALTSFGDVVAHKNGVVSTSSGDVELADLQVRRGQPRYETYRQDNSAWVIVAILVIALVSCGLGLILLFIVKGQTVTVTRDTVIIDAPNFQHVAVAQPGQDADAFVAWLTTWQRESRKANEGA